MLRDAFPDPLVARLRRLLGARPRAAAPQGESVRRNALEERLAAAHERQYGERRSGGGPVSPWPGLTLAARLAIAGVALTVAGVAACQIPVEVELELGRRLVFEVPAGPDAEQLIEALSLDLEGRTGAEKIEMRVHHFGGETMQARLDVWGEHIDLDVLEQVLADHGLSADEVEDLSLEGSVRTTWGDRLGHDFLDFELDLRDVDVAEARRRIIEHLEAEGVHGTMEVKVEDTDDGHRRVEIRVEEIRHEPAQEGGHELEPAP